MRTTAAEAEQGELEARPRERTAGQRPAGDRVDASGRHGPSVALCVAGRPARKLPPSRPRDEHEHDDGRGGSERRQRGAGHRDRCAVALPDHVAMNADEPERRRRVPHPPARLPDRRSCQQERRQREGPPEDGENQAALDKGTDPPEDASGKQPADESPQRHDRKRRPRTGCDACRRMANLEPEQIDDSGAADRPQRQHRCEQDGYEVEGHGERTEERAERRQLRGGQEPRRHGQAAEDDFIARIEVERVPGDRRRQPEQDHRQCDVNRRVVERQIDHFAPGQRVVGVF